MNVGFTWMTASALLLVLSASGPATAQDAELEAFPGADGWGAASKGGRGGRVIKVTNLNASGPGSLAEACAADGPRIIVFEVSGVIRSDDQGHSKGAHNFGLISAAKDNGAVSVHHNLWAHHARRVPCMAPYRENAASDFCNNLIYNCRGGYVDDGHGIRAKSPVNLYKNYYRRGPQTQDRLYPYALSPHMSYYVRDNYFEDWGYQGHPRHWKWGGPDRAPRWVQFNNNGRELDAPAKTPEIELVDAKAAFELILAKAGCWPRDRITKRTVHEVKTKTGDWGRNAPLEPTDQWFLEGLTQNQARKDTDGDGLPDTWEKSHNLDSSNPNDATNVVAAGESRNDRHLGYSHIEFYINELAENLVP